MCLDFETPGFHFPTQNSVAGLCDLSVHFQL